MESGEIKRFEREIEKSYQVGSLTDTAKKMLTEINISISQSMDIWQFGVGEGYRIKKIVLERLTTGDGWKGFFTAKEYIYGYFVTRCKRIYLSECSKLKRQRNKQG